MTMPKAHRHTEWSPPNSIQNYERLVRHDGFLSSVDGDRKELGLSHMGHLAHWRLTAKAVNIMHQ